ncbi:centrosomal protein CEP57L1 isoform X6 [Chrysemys picta bellii]|uniref:centrosomal protein CEP57L1 isoform X6 n=1 Tax=Chrysemys picta bellii TaxID=8478 RepID=UPI0032B26313
METSLMETMGSESKQSFIGSFLQPPDRMFVPTFGQSKSKKGTATAGDMLPAPNNQALMSALKTLQEKIRRLELERSQAEDNLSCLSIEAAQYKKTLQHETNAKDLAHEELIQQKKDVSVQLSAAQSHCSLLEKQLDYMRKMVFNAELEKNMVLEQQTQLQKEKDQKHMELHAKLEKLEVLEKECFRLLTTQRTAEDKIKILEEKLREEEHQRKLIQDKAAQLQTGLEINRILTSSVSSQNEPKKKSRKKKTAKHQLWQQEEEEQGQRQSNQSTSLRPRLSPGLRLSTAAIPVNVPIPPQFHGALSMDLHPVLCAGPRRSPTPFVTLFMRTSTQLYPGVSHYLSPLGQHLPGDTGIRIFSADCCTDYWHQQVYGLQGPRPVPGGHNQLFTNTSIY